MWTSRIGIAVALLTFAACVPPAVPPPGMMSDGEYVDREASFRLRIPRGWGDALRSGDAREKLRVRSSDGKAVVSVSVVSLGSSRCRIAIEEWLPKAHAAAFTSTIDRSVGISSRERPTVTGEIETLDGESSGTMSGFCDGDSAVIAVGLAKGGLTSTRRVEMTSLISSFGPLARVEPTPAPVAVKTPVRKKKPPVRPTRRPSTVRTAPPEPEATPVASKPTSPPKPTEAPKPTAPPQPTEAPEAEDDEILPER